MAGAGKEIAAGRLARSARRFAAAGAVALACAGTMGTPESRAQDDFFGDFEVRPYVGVDLGYLFVDYASDNIFGKYLADRLFTVDLQLGARLHRYFGFELGVFKAATGDKSGMGMLVSNQPPAPYATEVDAKGAYFDLLGYYQFSEEEEPDTGLEFIGSIGIARISAEGRIVRGPAIPLLDDTDTAIRYGLGAQYRFSDTLTMRALYRYHDVDFNDLVGHAESINLGVRYSF